MAPSTAPSRPRPRSRRWLRTCAGRSPTPAASRSGSTERCRPVLATPSRRAWRRGGWSPAPSRSRPAEPYGVTPQALTAARADFVTAVAADERVRVGGHREALGWVLADLHAGWPLT